MEHKNTTNIIQKIANASFGKNPIQVNGSHPAQTILVALHLIQSQAKKTKRNLVMVLPHHKEIVYWANFFESLHPQCEFDLSVFGHFNSWGNDRYINHTATKRQRLDVLAKINFGSKSNIILTTAMGLAQQTFSIEEFQKWSLHLTQGREYDIDELIEHLEEIGYYQTSKVDEEETFAVRGGIMDIFPVNTHDPIRLEFEEETLTSMRIFSTETQISKDELSSIHIAPAYECINLKENYPKDAQKLYELMLEQDVNRHDREGITSSLSNGARFSGFTMFAPFFREKSACLHNHLSEDSFFIFPKPVDRSKEVYGDFWEEIHANLEADQEENKPSLLPENHFIEPSHLSEIFSNFSTIEFNNPFANQNSLQLSFPPMSGKYHFPALKKVDSHTYAEIINVFQEILDTDGRIIILAGTIEEKDKIKNLLVHRGFYIEPDTKALERLISHSLDEAKIYLESGSLPHPLYLEDERTLIISTEFILGPPRKSKRSATRKLRNFLSSFKDLKVDDLVVHITHGIGRYKGMKTLTINNAPSEFLIIEYAQSDRVYLPVDKLNLLQRYAASGESSFQKVDKLGGSSWEKKKSRVKKSIKDMTQELLEVQAKRKLAGTRAYQIQPESYHQLEDDFPYQETEDQLKVLEEVEADFLAANPMDRLVVGDVGFGKTEIALRAAYRAVLEGYQVMVLVPTTVLCYQHYQTFKQRLSKFGVQVSQLNRFVKPKVQKETIARFKNGKEDILIGTHRILSKDISPQNLGMIVVDEEQRFGVGHKEKLKKFKYNTDILTLSATPIPRTLHMAMLGLRDISIITTPPQNRHPVKTYVTKFEESLIKDVIEKEINRGGQVFFVHNRVEDIREIQRFVEKLIPYAEARVGHGQMAENELENVIVDFIEQKFQILICTTIIESGIDMPNVNTIVVNNADHFGLAQLYQLKGRVGRSNVQAYAYFITKPLEKLSEEAIKRLDVLVAHQELGAGFHIASQDLEIRGSGNLLGGEQSGQVAAVGFELYTEMLDASIKELQGKEVKQRKDIEIKLGISAIIPATYIEEQNERLTIYRDIFATETDRELEKFSFSLEDRFGPLPEETKRLFKVAGIRIRLKDLDAKSLQIGTHGFFELKFASLTPRTIDRIETIIKQQPENYHLQPDWTLMLSIQASRMKDPSQQLECLDSIIALLDPLVMELEEEE